MISKQADQMKRVQVLAKLCLFWQTIHYTKYVRINQTIAQVYEDFWPLSVVKISKKSIKSFVIFHEDRKPIVMLSFQIEFLWKKWQKSSVAVHIFNLSKPVQYSSCDSEHSDWIPLEKNGKNLLLQYTFLTFPNVLFYPNHFYWTLFSNQLHTTTYKSRLTQKKLSKKTDAIFEWDVKNGFAYVLTFFSLISDDLGGVHRNS